MKNRSWARPSPPPFWLTRALVTSNMYDYNIEMEVTEMLKVFVPGHAHPRPHFGSPELYSQIKYRDGSHRDNFGESLMTLSADKYKSHGFLSRLQIFKSIGPSLWISLAHKTPFYDTKMLLKVIFDKTAFVKVKISNYFQTKN